MDRDKVGSIFMRYTTRGKYNYVNAESLLCAVSVTTLNFEFIRHFHCSAVWEPVVNPLTKDISFRYEAMITLRNHQKSYYYANTVNKSQCLRFIFHSDANKDSDSLFEVK